MAAVAPLMLVLVLLSGCLAPPDSGERQAFSGSIGVFTVAGHEYVVWDGYNKGGVVHHEGCPCQ